MEYLMELIPWWAPIVALLAMLIAWLYLKISYPEDWASESYDAKRAITIATLTVSLNAEPSEPNDPKIQWGARVFRNRLQQLMSSKGPWFNYPHVRLVAVRRGSVLFDYEIFILVTGSAIAVLNNYSSLKSGLKDLLEDVASVRRMVAPAFRKLTRADLHRVELRIVSEEELRESLKRFEAQAGAKVHARELADTRKQYP